LVPGFTANVRFDQGVRTTLDYISKHPELQKMDPEFDEWTDMMIAAFDSFEANLPKLQ
jgi:hypothetical protein